MPKASLKKMLQEQVLRADPEVQSANHRPSLIEIAKRRGLYQGEAQGTIPPAARSLLLESIGSDYPIPDWLITEDFTDDLVGPIKGGKEGDVSLVIRQSPRGRNLLAQKNYRDPSSRAFKRDQIYREGRKLPKTRDRKAAALGTSYGRKLMSDQWHGMEYFYLRRLWLQGASVPYPVSGGGGPLLMQYIGDERQAAPRLIDAKLSQKQARDLLEQILCNVRLFTREGVVHADLSAFNVLIWHGKVWVIDFPQAVDLASNPHAMFLLQRDIENVCKYFAKFKVYADPGEELARAVAEVY